MNSSINSIGSEIDDIMKQNFTLTKYQYWIEYKMNAAETQFDFTTALNGGRQLHMISFSVSSPTFV